MAPSPRARPLDLNETDRQMLAFAAELQFVLAAHVAAALRLDEGGAASRLDELADAGCLSRNELLVAEPAYYRVTRTGLGAIESDLGVPRNRVVMSNYRHEAGVAWLHVAAERGMFGPLREVYAERRMRSLDRRLSHVPEHEREQPLGIRLGPGAGGGERTHYPDLVMVTDTGHRVAFELELSAKPLARRERILQAYAGSRRVDAVVYLVDDPRLRRSIEQSVRRLGVSDRFRVEPVSVGHRETGPPARAPLVAARAGARDAPAAREASR